MDKIKFILPVMVMWLSFQANAAANRYLVFFKDKTGTPFSIDKPGEFLSQRAINRRQKQNIFVTKQDLPVSPQYIDDLKSLGFKVFFVTKWLNGALIDAEEKDLSKIQDLDFVKSVQLAAPENTSGRHSRRKGVNAYHSIKEKFGEPNSTMSTAAQNNMLGVDEMHKKGYDGQGLLIGIFDSGFWGVNQSSYFSDIFQGHRIDATRDFVHGSNNVYQFDKHGAEVFSCIAGYKPQEFEGTAYNANYVLCVTENVSSEFRVEEYNWLFAAEYADSLGVDVINSSVGYSYFDDSQMDYDYAQMDGKTAIISKAARIAASKGMIVVVSNGNEGNNNWKYLNAPADADSILSIGAVVARPDARQLQFLRPHQRWPHQARSFGDGRLGQCGFGRKCVRSQWHFVFHTFDHRPCSGFLASFSKPFRPGSNPIPETDGEPV